MILMKLNFFSIFNFFNYNFYVHIFFLTVHRIGRTGRSGKKGIATTFINKACGKYQTLSQILVYNFILKFNHKRWLQTIQIHMV